MSEHSYFERELIQRLADAAPPAAPGAVQRARLAIVDVPQRRGLTRLTSAMDSAPWMRAAAAVAVVVAALFVGYALGRLSPRVGDGPSATPSPSLVATPAESPPASLLPGLRLPGMSPNEPAGEYGWTGALGSRAGMHKVVGDDYSSDSRQTQLVFAIYPDCFAHGTGAEPEPVTVAGLDGLYLEPYADPDVLFFHRGRRGEETTGAYALPIGDRTLCVYLTWDPDTTQDELDAARQVVESIRGQPSGEDGIRINFTLPQGWDTG